MGFGWLGTFRQGQWQAYRSFILRERGDVPRRLAFLEAELDRVGRIRVIFAREEDGSSGEPVVTERRVGFAVSQGSTLERLVRAYVAQGGNPFDVSLFLTPEAASYEVDGGEYPTQPYGGVVYPVSGSYAVGTTYEGGYFVVKKYTPSRAGGRRDLQDNSVAGAVALTRTWVDPVIRHRLHDLEARIIKQCDLREQLEGEVDVIVAAVGGGSGALPTLDQDFYDPSLGVTRLVSSIDSAFYVKDDDGVPDFATRNVETLESYPSLLDDLPDEEDNTAL